MMTNEYAIEQVVYQDKVIAKLHQYADEAYEKFYAGFCENPLTRCTRPTYFEMEYHNALGEIQACEENRAEYARHITDKAWWAQEAVTVDEALTHSTTPLATARRELRFAQLKWVQRCRDYVNEPNEATKGAMTGARNNVERLEATINELKGV